MKLKNFILVFLLLCSVTKISAGIKAYFAHCLFSSPETGPYLETYLTVDGSTVVFKKSKNKFQGAIEVGMLFLKNGNIVKANKYNLLSPEINDTTKFPNFIDVQRFALPNGNYELELSIRDLNAPSSESFTSKQNISIDVVNGQLNISDIQFIESFSKSEKVSVLTKHGYDLIPYGINYYPQTADKLAFYAESYHADSAFSTDKRFAFVYYIESYETLEKISGYFSVSKQTAQKVNVILSKIDISKLPTGIYNLVVEIRDNANKVHRQKKAQFYRVNQVAKIQLEDLATLNPDQTFISHIKGADTLKDIIRSLWPISSYTERAWQDNQIKNADVKLMQQYIFAFWKNRNVNDPAGAYNKYREQVKKAQDMFGISKVPGYMTDRGRVFLQYGEPDQRQQIVSEPDSYPYEIWQYYRMQDPVTGQIQNNIRFIFWNREIADDNYELLHSDARNELKEARWQLRLKQRTQNKMNFDIEKADTKYGNQSDDIFRDPR